MPKFDFDSAPIIQPKKQNFDFDSAPIIQKEVSTLESAARGGVQGLTSGFADEATAGIESLLTPKSYEQALKESRAAYEAAEKANPITYNVGDIGGGLLQPTPFGKLKAATTGGKILLKAGQAGLMGGVETLGKSKDKTLGDLGGGALASGLMSGGLSGLGAVGGKLASKLPDKASIVGGLTMRDPKILREYSELPNKKLYSELNKINDPDEIATKLESTLKQTPFRKKASELSNQAYDILDKNKIEVNPSNALKVIDEKLARATNTPIQDTALIGYLEKTRSQLVNDAQNYGGTIPGTRIKGALQVMDAAGKGQQDYSEPVQRVAKDIRRALDTELKKDTEYADIMRKTEAATKADKRIQELFLTKGNIDPDKIKRQLENNKGIKSNRELQALSASMQKEGIATPYQSDNLQQLIDSIRVKKYLDNPNAKGSDVMNFGQGLGIGGSALAAVGGSAVGGGIGSSFDSTGTGATIGSLTGALLQRKSGAIARKAMDFNMPVPDIMNKVRGTKYETVLRKAAEVSPRKLAVNMYLLNQKDPEFRQQMGAPE